MVLHSQGSVAWTGKVPDRRFEIQKMPHNRVNGYGISRGGIIEDMRCVEVLFPVGASAEPNTPFQLSFLLPDCLNGQRAARVLCKATVTRSESPGNAGTRTDLATAISNYRIVGPQPVVPGMPGRKADRSWSVELEE